MQENYPKFKLVIGLGNPGKKYENTYHNAGFLFIDDLTKKEEVGWKKIKTFQFCRLDDTIFAKPLVYMNSSGGAAKDALSYFKLKPEAALVIHDDSDLYIGSYKLVHGRGAGGHHGIESIIESLGTKNFWRLRIGIRPPITDKKNPRKKAEEFVLKKISAKHTKELKKVAYLTSLKLKLKETPEGEDSRLVSGSSTF